MNCCPLNLPKVSTVSPNQMVSILCDDFSGVFAMVSGNRALISQIFGERSPLTLHNHYICTRNVPSTSDFIRTSKFTEVSEFFFVSFLELNFMNLKISLFKLLSKPSCRFFIFCSNFHFFSCFLSKIYEFLFSCLYIFSHRK